MLPTLRSAHSALAGLQERLAVLRAYVAGVRSGALPPNRALLRLVTAAATAVPVNAGAALQSALLGEAGDAMLVGLAGGLARGTGEMAGLADRLAYAASTGSGSGGGVGAEYGGGGGGGEYGAEYGGGDKFGMSLRHGGGRESRAARRLHAGGGGAAWT